MHQILNVNKPEGWTSFDVVRWLRRRIGRKIGHAGTLDPFATGVVLICIDEATKDVSKLIALEKEYEGCLELGIETDTLDITGRIANEAPWQNITAREIDEATKKFIGDVEQLPPMFSAVKINGQRLYKQARRGKVVERQTRHVKVHAFELIKVELPQIFFRVQCSKGTYIRTLAYDLAVSLGTVGFLRKLVRVKVGPYTLNDAYRLDLLQAHLGARS